MKKLIMIFLFVLMYTVGYGQHMITFLGKNIREVRVKASETKLSQEQYSLETENDFGLLIMSGENGVVYSFFFENNICVKNSLTTEAYLYASLISVLNKEYDRIDETNWRSEENNVYVSTLVGKYLTIAFKYKGY